MVKSKFILGLKLVKVKEWPLVERYFLMDFDKDSDQMIIFYHVMKYKKGLDHLTSKDEVRRSLFAEMSPKTFLNLLSQLYLKLEEWLVWIEMKNNRDKSDVLLVKILSRRGGEELADKKFRYVEKRLSNNQGQDLVQSRLYADLYHSYYFSESQAKYKAKGTLLEKAVKFHNAAFIEMSYLYLTEMENWGSVIGFDYGEVSKRLLQVIEVLNDSDVNHIGRLLHNVYSNSDQIALRSCIEMLDKDIVRSGSDLEVLVVLYVIQACRILFYSGELEDATLIYEAFSQGMKRGVLIRLGKFGAVRYTDIVVLLLRTAGLSKGRAFAEKWLGSVDEDERQEAKVIAEAYIFRHCEEYDKIIPIVRQVKFSNVRSEYIAYMLELMAWYKIEDFETLQIMLQNFNRRLRRIREEHKLLYKGAKAFGEVLKSLMLAKFSKGRLVDLDKYEVVFQKIWLQEEITSLRP